MSIIIASTGPLAGYPVASIDFKKLTDFRVACMNAHVGYGLGAKDPHAGSGKVDFTKIDCSGFMRSLLMYAGPTTFAGFPDGSCQQQEWFDRAGFKATTPDNGALSDGIVRVYIHIHDQIDGTGHIWLTVNGHTIESCGGRGVCQRPWDVMLSSGHTLAKLATHGYALCSIS